MLFGRYETLELVSKGGMGSVYRALDLELHRIVALKVLLGGNAATEEHITRFRREARAIASLKHPNIIPVFDVGESEGVHFFTMEFIGGRNLEDLIKSGTLGLDAGLRAFVQVCKAIQFAHDNGIIHRDIKPHNIIVDPDGNAHVMDFGLARDIESQTRITMTGMTMGTPPYMPPEQARGLLDELDSRSDVYSLGATLYEMLSGSPPYEGSSGMEIMLRVIEEDPVPVRKLNRSVPADLETICLKAMAREPDKRYSGADALRRDIERFQAGRSIHGRPPRGRLARGATIIRKQLVRHVILTIFSVVALATAFSYFSVMEYRDRVEMIDTRSAELPLYREDFQKPVPESGARDGWRILGGTAGRASEGPGVMTLVPGPGVRRAVCVNSRDVFSGFCSGTKIQFDAYIPKEAGGAGEFGIFLFAENPAETGGAAIPERTSDAVFDALQRTGYHFVLGADWNTHVLLLREGRIAASSDRVRLKKGKSIFGQPLYTVAVEKQGRDIRLIINGDLVLSFADDFPLGGGAKRSVWGFHSSAPGLVLDDVQVSKIGVARFGDPLEMGDDHFFLGHYEDALDRYALALESFRDTTTAARAAYYAAVCRYCIWKEKGRGAQSEVERDFYAVVNSDPSGEFASRARLFMAARMHPQDPESASKTVELARPAESNMRNAADIFALERGIAFLEMARAEWCKIAQIEADRNASKDQVPAFEKAMRKYLEAAAAFLERLNSGKPSDGSFACMASFLEGLARRGLDQHERAEACFRMAMGRFATAPVPAAMAAAELARHSRMSNDDQKAMDILWEAYGDAGEGGPIGDLLLLEICGTLRKISDFGEALKIYRGILDRADASKNAGLAALALVEMGVTSAESAFSGDPGKAAAGIERARSYWKEAAEKYGKSAEGPVLKDLLEAENYQGYLPAPLRPAYHVPLLGIGGALDAVRSAAAGSGFEAERRAAGLHVPLAAMFEGEGEGARIASQAAKLLENRPNSVLSYWLGILSQTAGDVDKAEDFYKSVWTAYQPRAWPYNLSLERLLEIRRSRK